MNSPLLQRKHYTPPAGLPFLGDLTLAGARVHEFCGPARMQLALMSAAALQGPIFWIRSAWARAHPLAAGFSNRVDPARITFVTPKRDEDILWGMEEVLRAGCVPLVIAELSDPPALTPVRRLHLAAESGAEREGSKPLGLILTPGDGGAQGVETRWHLAPKHTTDKSEWLLNRSRARMAPPASWVLSQGRKRVQVAPNHSQT